MKMSDILRDLAELLDQQESGQESGAIRAVAETYNGSTAGTGEERGVR